MEDKTEKKIKSRHITISFYTAFTIYFLIGLLRLINGSVIIGVSKILFDIIFIVLPILILALPFILNAMGSKSFGDCVKTAFIVSIIYATLSLGTEFGVKAYFTSFTVNKWANFPDNRYLMIDDLENNYNIIGMSKDEVESLLGSSYLQNGYYNGRQLSDNVETWTYGIKKEFLADKYYMLVYDRNGIVTETDTGKTTSSL